MSDSVDYLLIGHITADLTPEGRKLGGTTSYAAATAKAFGLRVGILTKVASGEPLLAQLASLGQIVASFSEATTTFENRYEPRGRRQFLRSRAAPIKDSDVPTKWLSAPLVHIAPIADEVDPQIVHRFPQSTILVTLQGWLRQWDGDGRIRFKRWFDPEVLKAVDIVVFSEEDIQEAPELETDLARAARHLILTRGEKGGTYYFQGAPSTYSAVPVSARNLTGAGDIFAAAVLSSLHIFGTDAQPASMQAAIRIAAKLAALSVTRVDLDSAPTPDEVQRIIHLEKKSRENQHD